MDQDRAAPETAPDEQDEALEETFPASDPPANTPVIGTRVAELETSKWLSPGGRSAR